MQAPQRPQNKGSYDPRLRSENKDRLDHRHLEPPRFPGVIPLLSKHEVETSPFTQLSLEVPDNGGTVTIVKGQHPANVFNVSNFSSIWLWARK